MLDDLRNSSAFIDDEEEAQPQEEVKVERRPARRKKQEQHFLGLSPQQRFILSLMIFFMVCVLGIVALVATNSINLAF